jgi:23S rRNA pseudouridine2605 synthase
MNREERLQKIIASAGVASRRKAEALIREGRVTVNGRVVDHLGARADPRRDHIKVDGKRIQEQKRKLYILLNKPRRVICSVADPQGRVKVTDLVDVREKIYPVGRLDYNTAGLILLTNDGEFARIVASAGSHLPKVYEVKTRTAAEESRLERLQNGIRLKNGVKLAPCRIAPMKGNKDPWYRVTLTQGKNRQIREMFESIGCPVVKLRRTRIGFLKDKKLAPGQYRFLTPLEVERVLRLFAAGRAARGKEIRRRGGRDAGSGRGEDKASSNPGSTV